MKKILRAATLLASIAASAPLLAQTFVYVSEADDGTIARYALNEQTLYNIGEMGVHHAVSR